MEEFIRKAIKVYFDSDVEITVSSLTPDSFDINFETLTHQKLSEPIILKNDEIDYLIKVFTEFKEKVIDRQPK